MNRRPFLHALATGSLLGSAGCLGSTPFVDDRRDATEVFEDYRYEGLTLVVRFRDDVERAVLFDSTTDEEYETVEQPSESVRFPVVFPDRLETYLTARPALRVRAETPDGNARQSVWDPIHGAARNVDPLPDGRARFDLENQGDAPLLVRFVGINGDDVPNPTADPQGDSFDLRTFDHGPGVVGVGSNRPLTSSRTDLVVPPGETLPFETTYAPFAFLEDTNDDCDGDERTGTITVVHGSGGSAAYTFTFRLEGERTSLGGRLEDGSEWTSGAVCHDASGLEE